ncbi:MAG: DUF924 domain-containing protein [Kangiellaceae bacterium]|nr:DUF924 domain-containing protein [Kangiellaceae bacterium]
MPLANPQDIIKFWFEETQPKFWFTKSEQFDQLIRDRFESSYLAATHCELTHWRETPEGRLAEIIILDQFSRNMYRDSAKAFAFDSLAVALCQEAIRTGDDQKLDVQKRKFLYMPLMHSESLVVHEQAVQVFNQPGLEDNYEYEIKHKVIIERFGRYPHRNKVLNRESTAEEAEFLQQPGSSF